MLWVTIATTAQVLEPIHWNAQVVSSSGDTVVRVQVAARIDADWHLYDMNLPEGGPRSTEFVVEGVDDWKIDLTKGERQVTYDMNFDMVLAWFESEAVWELQFPSTGAEQFTGYVEYMACDDTQCLPPTRWEWQVEIPRASSSQPAERTSLGWLFLMGLLMGLLAVFTPCVWPVIPMTVSFFIKRSENSRPIREALVYGVSIVVIYVTLGLLVTILFGAGALNELATNAVVNLCFFLLLVVFALSFFGAFEITLPASWSTKLDEKARGNAGVAGILFMAFTLVVVSFSCTGPLIGTLLVEAAGKSLLAPAAGMLGFAVALALPFSIFALFPQMMKRLPRSGGWMDSLKIVLAFLELALSLKFLSVADLAYGWHVLDREVFLAVWIVLFALLGLYLLGVFRFRHEECNQGVSVWRFLLALASLSFAVYMLPGLWGAPLKAISAFAPPLTTQDFVMHQGRTFEQEIVEIGDYEEALVAAKSEGKRTLLVFSGYGCVNCRKMEAKVLSEAHVQEVLARDYVVVTLIVDDRTALSAPLHVMENGKEKTLRTVGDRWSHLQRSVYGANAQPYYVKLDSDGRRIGNAFSYSEDTAEFINWLKQ